MIKLSSLHTSILGTHAVDELNHIWTYHCYYEYDFKLTYCSKCGKSLAYFWQWRHFKEHENCGVYFSI